MQQYRQANSDEFPNFKKDYGVKKVNDMWEVNIREAQLVQALCFEFDWHTSLGSTFCSFYKSFFTYHIFSL